MEGKEDTDEQKRLPSTMFSPQSLLSSKTYNTMKNNITFQRNLLLMTVGMLLLIIVHLVLNQPNSSVTSNSNSKHRNVFTMATKMKQDNGDEKDTTNPCDINLGTYHGPIYHSVASGTIGEPHCLLSSKWMQVSLHTVQFPNTDTMYDDWMWIDYHDRINVVVEDEPQQRVDAAPERHFFVFEQTKYALDGRTSLAIIGGIIEHDESAETTARREVTEEMNGMVECREYVFLGRYRTDVNRGMGWLHSFLATNCTRTNKAATNNTIHDIASSSSASLLRNRGNEKDDEGENDIVGVADTEPQHLISLTETQLRKALREGKFLEVQWTATIAQALHYIAST